MSLNGVQLSVNFQAKSLQLYYKWAFCRVFPKVKFVLANNLLFWGIWEALPMAAPEGYDLAKKKKEKFMKLNRL